MSLAVGLATAAMSQPRVKIRRGTVLARPTVALQLSDSARAREFSGVLSAKKIPAARQAEILKQYRSLPPDLQESVLAQSSPKWAQAAGLSEKAIVTLDPRYTKYRAVVVQVGEGLPSYEFAMFAQAVESHEFEPTTAIRALGTDGEDTPPSESMVF